MLIHKGELGFRMLPQRRAKRATAKRFLSSYDGERVKKSTAREGLTSSEGLIVSEGLTVSEIERERGTNSMYKKG